MSNRAPSGLGSRGRRFWKRVTGPYELRPDELEILEDACRTLDVIAGLEARLASVDLVDKHGNPAPAVKELRAQRVVARQLITALALPDPDGSVIESQATKRARKAADARYSYKQRRTEHIAEQRSRDGTT